jgi:protein tyrosine phosphatase (PTP) superfamily phosphohydrolase (DUF442 family)
MRHPGRILIVLSALFPVACGDSPPPPVSAFEMAGAMRLEDVAPEEHPDLHNVFRLGDSIISGGEPHGEAALARLAEMGVRTILTVDGKAPDAETAARLGMRYVHVPIRYRGISADDLLRIAKTFRELPAPFYVHCFHGKHRGPAAAAWGRIVLDGAPRERALAEMRQWCGTSEKYGGLYETIARAEVPTVAETRALDWDFPSARGFEGFRQSMVGVSRSYDLLERLSKRGWRTDPEHPDVSATNEAAKLEQLLAAGRDLDETDRPADFRAWLDESVEHARTLRESVTRAEAGGEGAVATADAAFTAIRERCDACHKGYRND